MQLIIAEKPSVARDLARVLGVRASGRNSLEGQGRVITWCIGHLVELEEPAAYDPRWKAWRMDTLPMIPAAFKLRPVPGTRDQLKVVRDLLRDRRFSEVVNACDAGREGELIFRYVYELAQSRLPVRRLWISSLTDEAIRQGFAGLRPGAAYDALGDAARCRSEADWLVGMNATRAVTIRFRATAAARGDAVGGPDLPAAKVGAAPPASARRPLTKAEQQTVRQRLRQRNAWRADLPAVYSIGRVQTPTLAILVRRELEIRAFQPRDYWEVRGTFATEPATGGAGPTARATPPTESFTALWTIRSQNGKGSVTRFGTRALADQIVARARDSGGTVGAGQRDAPVVEQLVQKRTRESPPQLFDLTSLQRTANRRFGMSATRTLEAAQALYERHKVLTYPRTDSRHLPQDLVPELPKLFRGLAKMPDYAAFAQPLLDGDITPATRSRRVFDNAKVHDHHAIIPTGKIPPPGALGQDEHRLFDLVARRFLGVFHPDAEFALTEAVIRVGRVTPSGGSTPPLESTEPADANEPVEPIKPTGGQRPSVPVKPAPVESPPAEPLPEETVLTAPPPPPDRFIARGRVRLVAGWQTVAGFDEARTSGRPFGEGSGDKGDATGRDGAESTLPPLTTGQRLDGRFEAIPHQTRPPPRHTEATLLGAMESAGREIEDEALRAAMKETGLGTPATRASTIETLVKRGFIARAGKQVTATPTGIALIEGLPVPTLASPELTGTWEARLVRVARGQDTRAAFMTDIVRYVTDVMNAVRGVPATAPIPATTLTNAAPAVRPAPPRPPSPPRLPSPSRPAALPTTAQAPLPCPRCRRGHLVAGNRGWGCSEWRAGCAFVVWFTIAGKRITDTQLRDLIEKGKTRKAKWAVPGNPTNTGRLVLDMAGTREQGAARFRPE